MTETETTATKSALHGRTFHAHEGDDGKCFIMDSVTRKPVAQMMEKDGNLPELLCESPDLYAFLNLFRAYREKKVQLSELDRADDKLRESGL